LTKREQEEENGWHHTRRGGLREEHDSYDREPPVSLLTSLETLESMQRGGGERIKNGSDVSALV